MKIAVLALQGDFAEHEKMLMAEDDNKKIRIKK